MGNKYRLIIDVDISGQDIGPEAYLPSRGIKWCMKRKPALTNYQLVQIFDRIRDDVILEILGFKGKKRGGA
jgi:hypothetical protein